MFIFQLQKSAPDSLQADSTLGKKVYSKTEQKAISNLVHWAIMSMPVGALNSAVGGDYGKGLKCIVHYLNGTGKPLKLEFTKKEWEFIIGQTNVDFKQFLGKGYYELEPMKKDPQVVAALDADYQLSKYYVATPGDDIKYGDYEAFKERMKKSGHDLDKMNAEMKVGEYREFADNKGRPYIAHKGKSRYSNGADFEYFDVSYNRKWLPADSDGWERMHMVPAALQPSDAWNVAGFTTVARRKRADGGMDYKIEEKFDFEGSGRVDIVSGRHVPSKFAKVAVTLFPSFLKIEKVGGGDPGTSWLEVNSSWLKSAGKKFELDISMHTDKNGNIYIHGEEPGRKPYLAARPPLK